MIKSFDGHRSGASDGPSIRLTQRTGSLAGHGNEPKKIGKNRVDLAAGSDYYYTIPQRATIGSPNGTRRFSGNIKQGCWL